ncbi:MAG: GGDEF domain-containing protein [Kurthia sp.]|nr:GGDEF domain-containing protein [Candidatus Kurthia equi]
MVIASLLLAVVYLGVRIQFSRYINFRNSKQEIRITAVSVILLITSCTGHYLFPNWISVWVGLAVASILLMQYPHIVKFSSRTVTIIIVGLLLVLVSIPYVQFPSFILVSAYFTYMAFKTTMRKSLIAGAGIGILAPLAVFLIQFELVYYGVGLYLVFCYFGHTTQLLEMMKNAGKNVILDPLTGLYNRRWLFSKANQLAAEQEIGIIFCDIDNFKQINDTKGHEYGDIVLKKAGEIMQRETKGYGFTARYGGEELVCLMSSPKQSEKVAEKILAGLQKEINVTMSIGVAYGRGEAESIIKIADERMYISKKSGKNRITSED